MIILDMRPCWQPRSLIDNGSQPLTKYKTVVVKYNITIIPNDTKCWQAILFFCEIILAFFYLLQHSTLHYRLRCPLGRFFFSQKMFKSKVLFLSEKKVYLSRSGCFAKIMTQIFYSKNCSKYLENKIWRY